MSDPRLLYQTLLAATDFEAKDEYEVDPRVLQYATRNAAGDIGVYTAPDSNATVQDEIVNILENQILDSLASPVQDQPDMKPRKNIVIIDTAQRDWTVQPDAYSNTFTFGTQTPKSDVGPLIPYYYNNPVIPYSAYDMPVQRNDAQRGSDQLANITSHIIDTSIQAQYTLNQQFGNNGMLANTWGWRLVIASDGTLKHVGTPIVPTDHIYYFPVYNSQESRGATIGVEPSPPALNTTLKFGTQLKVSNVQSLKLARATLPMRKFDTYDTRIFTDKAASIVNQTAGLLNTFHNEPYILMTVENMKGQYYGAAQVVQNAFAALVQQNRTPIDVTNSALLGQYQDYYPWSDEVFKFDPPLAQLSNAKIALSNSIGEPFSHLDELNVLMITVGTASGLNVSSGKGLGTLKFAVTRNQDVVDYTPANVNSHIFSKSDVRPGDEIVFYKPKLTTMMNDDNTTDDIYYFLDTLYSNSIIVTSVYDFNISAYPLLDAAYGFDAVFKTTGFQNMLDIYSNLSVLAYNPSSTLYTWTNDWGSNVSGDRALVLPSSIYFSSNSISETIPGTFAGNYVLPIMNLNMQATYAFEVTTLEADTTKLQKIIPN